MKNITIVVILACVASCVAKDLIVGNIYGTRLVWQDKVNAMSFPFKKTIKQVFYSNPEQIPIRGVYVKDLDHVSGSVESVTSGGVGFTYVNIRLKSERGHGLNYQIQVYV